MKDKTLFPDGGADFEMGTTVTAKPQIWRRPKARTALPCRTAIFLAVALVVNVMSATAQQPTQQAPAMRKVSAAVRKPIPARTRPSTSHPSTHATPSAEAVPAPAVPPIPKLPNWPANDQPVAATVVWNSQGLRIEASNSSLKQILNDVATATGARVEGMGSDQRIFGSYGPGPPRDVLSQLLDGSGYNVLMVGDQGQGTPRQIVLSAPPRGDAPIVANNPNSTGDDSADADDQPQPQPQPQMPPPAVPNGFAPGQPPRTPQQIMQEMQQRQQQILQQNNIPQ